MSTLFRFLFRAVLLAAGLVFALSLLFVMVVVLVFWGLRAIWCKLTGKPVLPFSMRMNPRSGFEQVFQAGRRESPSTESRPGSKNLRPGMQDVTDVEPKR